MKGMISQTVSPIQTFEHFFSLCFEASDFVSDLEGFLGNVIDGELMSRRPLPYTHLYQFKIIVHVYLTLWDGFCPA
jgi:hypothetical protein